MYSAREYDVVVADTTPQRRGRPNVWNVSLRLVSGVVGVAFLAATARGLWMCLANGDGPSALVHGWHLSTIGWVLFTTFEIGIALAVVFASRRPRPLVVPAPDASFTPLPALTILVPAHNEQAVLATTLTALLHDDGPYEILVIDDGSSDRTREIAYGFAQRDARLRVLSQARQGKAAALNTGIHAASSDFILTLDADTCILPGSLAAIQQAFLASDADVVFGRLAIADDRAWLRFFQRVEYAKTAVMREGWANLWCEEQVPGALSAFRKADLQSVGGFPVDSLTEDYELMFRLLAHATDAGKGLNVVCAGAALANTVGPGGVRALFLQRQRWFAGFLLTLWRYRGLMGARRAGAFGLLKMPLKLLDAAAPALMVMGLVGAVPLLIARDHTMWLLVAFALVTRASVDVALVLVARHRAPRAFASTSLWAVLLEPVLYTWIIRLAALSAYITVARGVRKHEWSPTRA